MTVRALFMGSDAIALPMLKAVLAHKPGGVEWAGIVTQPDRKSGRGMKLQANAIKQWALENDFQVWQPEQCGENEVELIHSLKIDLVVVMAYGQLLREPFLEAPRLGVLNLHASLLPKLRGASPIHTALASGEAETGISLMRIVRKLDAGPVADQERVAIDKNWIVGDLIEAMSQACVPLMLRTLPLMAKDNLHFREQDSTEVTYCRIIEKSDGHLDFSLSAKELELRWRAFQPWPGSFFVHEKTMIRVLEMVSVPADEVKVPGTVLWADVDGVCVACGEGRLKLKTLQRAGGKPLSAEDFLRGYSFKQGDVLKGGEAMPLVFEKPFRRKKA